jgi:hypothetical protein
MINDRAKNTDNEFEALKNLAKLWLTRTGKQLNEAVDDESLQVICNDK